MTNLYRTTHLGPQNHNIWTEIKIMVASNRSIETRLLKLHTLK